MRFYTQYTKSGCKVNSLTRGILSRNFNMDWEAFLCWANIVELYGHQGRARPQLYDTRRREEHIFFSSFMGGGKAGSMTLGGDAWSIAAQAGRATCCRKSVMLHQHGAPELFATLFLSAVRRTVVILQYCLLCLAPRILFLLWFWTTYSECYLYTCGDCRTLQQ